MNTRFRHSLISTVSRLMYNARLLDLTKALYVEETHVAMCGRYAFSIGIDHSESRHTHYVANSLPVCFLEMELSQ